MPTVPSPVTGWLLLTALVLSLGAVAGRWVILPRTLATQGVAPSTLEAGAARMGLVGGVLLWVALGLVFWRQLAEFRDPFVPWTEDAGLLLTATDWGSAWKLATAGAVLLIPAFLVAARGSLVAWGFASVLTFALAAFPAFTGHAAATEALRPLTLAADTFHVWAAGGWLGGLTLVLFLEGRWRRSPSTGGPASLLPGLVGAFSPVAMICVGALIVTGLLAAWVQLPTLADLVLSSYGRLLLLKVALALVAFGLGGLNWRRLTPRLRDAGGAEAMRRAAMIEMLVAHGVLIVTAILVRTSPTGH